MRLILVRHYKTLNNACRRILGWTDSPPVPHWEEGLAQLERVLRERGLQFDWIYSSRLERARATAEWFAQRYGGLRVRECTELNEVDYGELAQLCKRWVAEHVPEYKRNPSYVFPHGESFQAMRERSLRCVLGMESEHESDTLLVVAHAGVIRGLITHFLELSFADNLRRKVSHRYIGDFLIHNQRCVRYDELGEPSGFIRDGVIEIPCGPKGTEKMGGTGMVQSEPQRREDSLWGARKARDLEHP